LARRSPALISDSSRSTSDGSSRPRGRATSGPAETGQRIEAGYDAEMSEIVVVDNPAESRYEARQGDRVLGIVDYELDPEVNGIVLVHTEVDPDSEGEGVGGRLAKGALEDVRSRGLKLTVECEFIKAYLKRHPGDYADLVAG
jgi:predicted GNAT family acetyltransferase